MPARGRWTLVAAAVAAVVTVSAATVVWVDRVPSTIKKITGTTAETPGLAWSLDPAESLGRPFAAFADPRGGTAFTAGEPGMIRSGDTLLTIVGTPNEGTTLGDPVMIGIDARTGGVRWQAPAHDLVSCSETPLHGKIYCHAMRKNYELITYDIESGESERRRVSESIFAITTTSDALYVAEGSVEDDDVRVHSGTFDDVSAHWTRHFDMGASYEEVYASEALTVTDGVGLVRTGGDLAQFDTRSGAELWSSGTQCVGTSSLLPGGFLVHADCESAGLATEQFLRGPDGKVIASTSSPTVQRPGLESTTEADPVLLGDSAYDRATGELLWTNKDLTSRDTNATGTVTAVVGGVVYVMDSTGRSDSGIDLRTGKRLWHRGWPGDASATVNPDAYRNRLLAGSDGITLAAVDVTTGEIAWTAPFLAIDSDPDAFVTGRALEPYGDGWIFSSDRRMIGLAAL
ncbi:outer membrane protein assembly factor BamB family protein [Gordonia terrae]|uniref:outer membrane protein assembly factor BamB family protein n=1 Tax=Gordonia terrae TaxID=2055 RepID=UPI003F6D6085